MDASKTLVIETDNLCKTYKSIKALCSLSLGPIALDLRLLGTQWGWQNHHDQAVAWAGAPNFRQWQDLRLRHRQRERQDPQAGWLPGSGPALVRAHDRP